MKRLPWFVLLVVATVTVTFSFSQDPAPLRLVTRQQHRPPVAPQPRITRPP